MDEFALREARRRSHDEQEQAKLIAKAEGGTVAAQQQQQQHQQHEQEVPHQQHHPQKTQLQHNAILPIDPLPPMSLLLPPVPPSGNPLVDEIMKISRDYVQSGGDNPAIMRAIQGLYSDALLPQPAQSAPPHTIYAAPIAAPQPPTLMANPIQDHLQTLIQQVCGSGVVLAVLNNAITAESSAARRERGGQQAAVFTGRAAVEIATAKHFACCSGFRDIRSEAAGLGLCGCD